MMSWLVAPQCTYRAASGSLAETRAVSWRIIGMAMLPSRCASDSMSASSSDSARAQARIDRAAGRGITPMAASASASAASTSSIACRRARTEKCVSDIKEDSFAAPLEDDVESIAIGFDSFGDQGRSPLGRDERQNLVLRVRRFVLEIQPGDQPRQHTACEHADGKMRRLQLAAAAGDPSGDDRLEGEFPSRAGRDSPEPVECRIERPILAVG